jgi:hypothetical protein
MKHWWCMECQEKVELNKHGRCEICGSEAIDSMWTECDLTRPVSADRTETGLVTACS